MSLIYGRKWDKQFEGADGQSNSQAIQLWMVSLVQRNISLKELKAAASKTLDKHPDFAPRLPQVIEMCRLTEEDLGLPEVMEAYIEATKGRGRYSYQVNGYWKWAKQTHLAIYHATQLIVPNLYTFDRVSSSESFQMFERAWDRVIKRLLRGEQLEPVPYVLEQQTSSAKKPVKKGKGYAEMKKWLSQR